MSEFGVVVVFEAEALALVDSEADSTAREPSCAQCWLSWDAAVLAECAAVCVSEPEQFYVTTDPVRLAEAARTAARRAGGAR